MPKSNGKRKTIEAQMERSDSEDREQSDKSPGSQQDQAASASATNPETVPADDWWSPSPPASDWEEPAVDQPVANVLPRQEPATADVYFCGRTSLFPFNRALQAVANEKLTGLLRAFWDKEPIELLAREGQIVFVTTRDSDLYCPETPASLADVDIVMVDRARARQRETGIPFFLTLAQEEAIASSAATELMRSYGPKLFSQLWTAPSAWIVFEKKTDLLDDARDVPGEPDVDNWALETLRLVQNPDQPANFEPASIPAYTKDGFKRVQRLKLTSDEAQFASQFNGARSVQQIAKNLRLDLKSARQLLFRFLALEIVECWPASAVAKSQKQGVFQRVRQLVRRER
jgi:hypothetical protein